MTAPEVADGLAKAISEMFNDALRPLESGHGQVLTVKRKAIPEDFLPVIRKFLRQQQ